jgi:hypothetical protein
MSSMDSTAAAAGTLATTTPRGGSPFFTLQVLPIFFSDRAMFNMLS